MPLPSGRLDAEKYGRKDVPVFFRICFFLLLVLLLFFIYNICEVKIL